MRILGACLVAVALVLGGCQAVVSPSIVPSAPSFPPSSPVEGVIVEVVSAGLDKVTGFTLRTADGSLYGFLIDNLENGAQFPPGHLTEHQATSEPVRVYFTILGRMVFATRIEDAGTPAPS